MVEFNFYKAFGKWNLCINQIKDGETTLDTITFDESVDYEDIIKIAPVLGKGDISSININFTGEGKH